jgi:hypothetical protein
VWAMGVRVGLVCRRVRIGARGGRGRRISFDGVGERLAWELREGRKIAVLGKGESNGI